jgi:hypothetical protein
MPRAARVCPQVPAHAGLAAVGSECLDPAPARDGVQSVFCLPTRSYSREEGWLVVSPLLSHPSRLREPATTPCQRGALSDFCVPKAWLG